MPSEPSGARAVLLSDPPRPALVPDAGSLERSVHAAASADRLRLPLNANENGLTARTARVLATPLGQRYLMDVEREVCVFGRNAAFAGMPAVSGPVKAGREALRRMLGADRVTLDCLSGVHAMTSVVLAATRPGDTVMTVPSDQGGHHSTAPILASAGRRHAFTRYDRAAGAFDVAGTARAAAQEGVTALYLDTSVLVEPVPVRALRAALPPHVTIVVDASHLLGLVLGGACPNPLDEGADILCGSTHKTFPGPQKGIVAVRDGRRFGAAMDLIEGSLVSSVHTASTLALAIALVEFEEYGAEYAHRTVANAQALGRALTARGLTVRTTAEGRFSRTHQVHCRIEDDRATALHRCLANGITTSVSGALGDHRFLRLGVQEVTLRGMREDAMEDLARLIRTALDGGDCRADVERTVRRFPAATYGAS
ncbi:hypothetical protein [Streptomyces sp. NPDC058401]|uniref:hypothetical protein n=1 Tax=Streptomyces sp. NPDC058401 TaxID=3346480 RepID=UPI003653EC10